MLCVAHGRAWGFLGEWFQQLLGVNLSGAAAFCSGNLCPLSPFFSYISAHQCRLVALITAVLISRKT